MLLAPSPHASNAPAPVPTRFRGPESRPPRGVLISSHTNHILQPTSCRARTANRVLAGAITVTPHPRT
jgi:hypothetical protein